MNIKPLHPNFQAPTRGSDKAGGYDIYMPEGGMVTARGHEAVKIGLGFAAEVPEGYVAKIYPRSGKGAKHGLALNNTVGIIDSDYRGEWMAAVRVHDADSFYWKPGERLFQFVLVPVLTPELTIVNELDTTERGEGGFGSSGQ